MIIFIFESSSYQFDIIVVVKFHMQVNTRPLYELTLSRQQNLCDVCSRNYICLYISSPKICSLIVWGWCREPTSLYLCTRKGISLSSLKTKSHRAEWVCNMILQMMYWHCLPQIRISSLKLAQEVITVYKKVGSPLY